MLDFSYLTNHCSDQEQERSHILEFGVFIDKNNFLELSVVGDLSSHVIVVERLSNLESERTLDGKGFELNTKRYTLRVITAPDSTSPNLKNPVVKAASVLKNLHSLLLYSGNLASSGIPLSYSKS